MCYPAARMPGANTADPLLAAESVVVQGIIDCAFEEDGALILLDYKTDRVHETQTLIDRYQAQLQMYKTAMEQCFHTTVREMVIYSFWLGEEIQIA
jgi:ATP-dependent helicase/nuclease subunit A